MLNDEAKRPRHPSPERIQQLWQIFAENVDPLTKVVHIPTVWPAIQKAASNTQAIPRSFEALMFAIYAAAIMSLKDNNCKQRLGESRKTLLSQYVSATKTALARAKFMGTSSLVVLQALVLHLLSVRDIYEPRAVWSLTGVAVRIGQGMGLERDGVALGLPLFETEIRRRVWWLLKTHDFRAAELCGLPKFRDLDTTAESTKFPTNVNDRQLYPGMPSLPVESNTMTDTVFIALRYELMNFAAARVARFREQGKSPSQWNLHASGIDKEEIEKAFKGYEEMLETKYLRYCDPSQPLQLITMLLARVAMNGARFLMHHPRRWASIEQTPISERQFVWELSIKILEQQQMWRSSPQIQQYAWHAAYFQQWHTFIHVLDTLQANALHPDAEKAWQLIENTYESNEEMIFDMKKPIHVAVGNLCLNAYGARQAALQADERATPEFILQLRQQRENTIAKRQARNAKGGHLEDPARPTHGNGPNVTSNPDASVMDSTNNPESPHPQQSIISHLPNLAEADGAIESDPFWFIDDNQVGGPNDVMEMDLDLMLVQDQGGQENTAQPINWEQWDAWLADSNTMRPLS